MGKDQKPRKPVPDVPVPDSVSTHSSWIRLQDQLEWYDSKSTSCQFWFKSLKTIQVILAVAVPLLAHLPACLMVWATSLAGAGVAVLEGLQGLNQYATLWVTYRATAEHLKHEMFLFLAGAGQYRGIDEQARLTLLAERVEEHVSTEHANWFDGSHKVATKGTESKA